MGRERTPQLIGREESLRALTSALGRVDPPKGSLVLVSGEAGIGKTRVLEEFAARIPDVLVARGGCVEDVAYAPWADALWWLLQHQPQATDSVPARVRSQLARLLPSISLDESSAAPDEGGQQLLFESVVELLGHVAGSRRLVVVLDDVHWIDPASRELLRYVAGNLRRLPILLVAAFRGDETERELITQLGRLADERVELERLPNESAAEIATILLGDKADDEDVERITRNADGNPLFVEELVAAADTQRIPPTLRDLMLARFMLLDKEAQHLVRVAAVTGATAPRAWLVAASKLNADDARTAARAAVDIGVLVARDNGYAFRHALLREAVLDELLPDELVALHHDIARALDEDPKAGIGVDRVAELARHWDAAEEAEPALRWNVAAAQQAQRNYALEAACQHYDRALLWWDAAPDPVAVTGLDHAALTIEAAEVAHDAGHVGRAADLARAGVDEAFALDPERGVDAASRAYPLLWNASRADEFFDYANAHVLPVLDAVGASTRARFLVARADHILVNDTAEESRRAVDEMMAGLGDVDDPVLRGRAHMIRAWSHEKWGEFDAMNVEFDRAATLVRQSDSHTMLALVLLNHASAKMGEPDLVASLALLDEVDVLIDKYGLRRLFSPARCFRAQNRCLAGDLENASAALQDLDGLLLEGLDSWHRAVNEAEIALARGDHDRALELLVPETVGSAPPEDAEMLITIAVPRAQALAWKEDTEAARQVVDDARVRLQQHPETYYHGWLAMTGVRIEADIARSSTHQSVSRIEHAEQRATAMVESWRIAVAQARDATPLTRAQTLAIEAEYGLLLDEGAVERMQAAAEAFEAVGIPYYAIYFRWREAQALIDAGARPQATELLKRARATGMHHAFDGLVEAMNALARSQQLRLGPARTNVDGEDALSVRELEVLRLMAEGRSNPEIAETLFITRRTAAAHVSNILKKLDTSTRVEAVSEALRRGYV